MSREEPGTGGMVSRTVTAKRHDARLRQSSLAVQVQLELPRGSHRPEGGQVTVRGASQLSVYCAVNVPAVAPRFTHSRVWGAGHVSLGGVLSTTTTHAE